MTIYADPGPDEFRTGQGRAMVYSGIAGGVTNHQRATAAARARGAQLIEETRGGRALNAAAGEQGATDLYQYYRSQHHERLRQQYVAEGKSPADADAKAEIGCNARATAHWNRCSRHYAEQASGSVETYVVGARERGTFRRHELPALLRNEAVTDINGVPRQELAALSRTGAYERICEAELARDRTGLRSLDGADRKALEADLEARRATLEAWRDTTREQDLAQERRRAEAARGERLPPQRRGDGAMARGAAEPALRPERRSAAPGQEAGREGHGRGMTREGQRHDGRIGKDRQHDR